jgi:hypothetical protein
MMKAAELAIFRLKPDANEGEFRAAVGETDRWLARQPGFLLRRRTAWLRALPYRVRT